MNVRSTAFALILTLALASSAFPQHASYNLPPIRTIKLPIPAMRGVWWNAHMRSAWVFAMEAAPDHSILILDADKNGRWPLFRSREWWTDHPQLDSVQVPGWSAKDAANLRGLSTAIKVTPDGRYAIALANAYWEASGPHEHLHAARPSDSILSVIDLESMTVVRSTHALQVGVGVADEQRTVSDRSLLIRTQAWGTNESDIAELFLPELSVSARCKAARLDPTYMKEGSDRQKAHAAWEQSELECAPIFADARAKSLVNLASILKDGYIQPPRITDPNGLPLDLSFLPAKDGNWYTLDTSGDSRSSMAEYDRSGRLLRSQEEKRLLCLDQPVTGPAWGCSCKLVSVSTGPPPYLLAECLTEHDTFFGGTDWLNHWLPVFRADTFAPVARLQLPNRNAETQQVLLTVEGHTYALVTTLGESLTIYSLP